MATINKTIEYIVDGESVKVAVEGTLHRGNDKVMLDYDHNLIADLSWADKGYVIADFQNSEFLSDFKLKLKNMIAESVLQHSGNKLENPEDYHKKVDEVSHYKIVSDIYNRLSFKALNIDKKAIENRVSQILNREVTTKNPYMDEPGFLNEDIFNIRIVRPFEGDNNPYHRDVWLDRLRHAVNIYLPLWGSNEKSSLPLVPKSHRWMESEIERTTSGDKINGKKFTVPAVTWTKYGLESTRPNPAANQFMVFSPYMIHGGGKNFNEDVTRISLELRFWAKKGDSKFNIKASKAA